MKRLLVFLIVAALAGSCLAQNNTGKPGDIQMVTVTAKGIDVRDVLSDMFTQAKKSFVIEPNIHFVLFLSLNDVEFEEALDLVCKTAGLKYDQQNGIYFVSKDKAAPAAVVPAKPALNRLPDTVLKKHVTIEANREDLRQIFSRMATSTAVPLRVDAKVPNYKVDLSLKDVTLKYALTTICRAAGLTYKFSNDAEIDICLPTDLHPEIRIEAPKS